MREIPRPPPSNLSRIIEEGQGGGPAHDAMMTLLIGYDYQSVKPSSAFASAGANLDRRMEAWEGMPYPQSDTIQELQFAMSRNLLTREDLAAVQDAIQARQ
jgi:hypothetical protein